MGPTEKALLEALQGVFRKHARCGYDNKVFSFPPEWEVARIAIRDALATARVSQPNTNATYSIAEFCREHGISRGLFYNLQRGGRGPRVMKVGSRTLISREAVEEWRRRMETGRGS